MTQHSAKRINRADLIRALHTEDDMLLSVTAEMCGFKPPKKTKVSVKLPPLEFELDDKGQPDIPKPKPPKRIKSQPHYYRVIDQKQSEILPGPATGGEKPKPQWLEDTQHFDPDKVVPLKVSPPEKEPLVAWAKLWPVLRSLLSEHARTRQPDIPRIVKTIANGHWLAGIPRKMRRRWTANVYILVDRPQRTSLFNQDYNHLLQQLKQLRGVTGLILQRILHQPGGRVRQESGKQQQVQDWQVPEAGSTVCILSDLGLLDESGIAQRAWLKVGKQLQLAGCRPMVLLPLPERYLTAELVALFECISWHRNSLLRRVSYVQSVADQPSAQQQDRETAEDLLAWLSPAVQVEPSLLRAVRHQLPRQYADVGHEAIAWRHEDVVRSAIGFHFQPRSKIIEKYRVRFIKLKNKKENRELAIRIAGLILQYHRHLFPTQRYEELLLLKELLGDEVPADPQDIAAAQQHMQELVKAGWDQADDIPGGKAFLLHQIERQHLDMVRNHEFYQVVWGYKHYELGEPDGTDIPEGFDPQNVLACVDVPLSEQRDYALFQEGLRALQLSTRERYLAGDEDGFNQGSELTHFVTPSTLMLRQHRDASGHLSNRILPLDDQQTLEFPLQEKEIQLLHVAGQELTIERFVKPEWAFEIGQDQQDLYSESMNTKGEVYRWYWYPPEWSLDKGLLPGFWYSEEPHSEWARLTWRHDGRVGRDQYGLYLWFEIEEIPLRFRWIEPTTFFMGSPEDEDGRYSDEIQHKVTLTQGYWMAETTVSQALWQAVMSKNPSGFKNENNPIERVSWEDVKQFLDRVNKQYPELKLRLPTEAEWENACRAGTTTAFHFGGKDDLNLEQVNYSGKWDNYDTSGTTKLVKSYPSNPWGIYEMHGNVLEWCSDWYGDYPAKPVIDPIGPDSGGLRVLRGGSWFDDGRFCRSACRNGLVPGLRDNFIGFRLARGHELQPVRTVQAGQQQIGSQRPGGAGSQAGDGRPHGKEASPEKHQDVKADSIKDRLKGLIKR